MTGTTASACVPAGAAAGDPRVWGLYTAWCVVRGVPPIPATEAMLDRFFTDVPCAPSTRRARLQAIWRAHDRVGTSARPPRPRLPAPVVAGIRELIAAQPVSVRGRRDRALLTVIAAGLPRRRIARLTPADVTQTGGVWQVADVPLAAAGTGVCPACQVACWVLLVEDTATGRRQAAADTARRLARIPEGMHVCAGREAADALPRLSGLPVLFPPLDRHGWAGHTPLTRRSQARILRRPVPPSGPPPAGFPPTARRSSAPADPSVLYRDMGDVDAQVDRLTVRIDELEAQLHGLTGL